MAQYRAQRWRRMKSACHTLKLSKFERKRFTKKPTLMLARMVSNLESENQSLQHLKCANVEKACSFYDLCLVWLKQMRKSCVVALGLFQVFRVRIPLRTTMKTGNSLADSIIVSGQSPS